MRLGRCCVELHYGIVYLVYSIGDCEVAKETGSKIVRKTVPQCNLTHHLSLTVRLQNGWRSCTLFRRQKAPTEKASHYRPCSRGVIAVSWKSSHYFSIKMPSITTPITGKVSYLNRHERVTKWHANVCQKFEAHYPGKGIVFVNFTRGRTPTLTNWGI